MDQKTLFVGCTIALAVAGFVFWMIPEGAKVTSTGLGGTLLGVAAFTGILAWVSPKDQ